MEHEQRLIDLETKVAYQDKTIEDLSDVIYKQQQEITMLAKTVELLRAQVLSISSGDNEIRGHEKPPHY